MALQWLRPGEDFPDVRLATPEGMLAVGGDFSWRRLHRAYSLGIFPWSNPEDPIIWWSPDPRFVLYPADLKVQRSMRPYLNQGKFRVSYDTRFREVITACQGSPRQGRDVGTWISDELLEGYVALHEQGFAHSVEVWDAQGDLVGGLYGVALGRVFCGESMFARASNASKYGFIRLVQDLERRGYWLIDCQMPTPHLASLGAAAIPRSEFVRTLALNRSEPTDRGSWSELQLQ